MFTHEYTNISEWPPGYEHMRESVFCQVSSIDVVPTYGAGKCNFKFHQNQSSPEN